MTRLLMHGPSYSRLAITSFLEVAFPEALIDLRNEWGMTEEELPNPVKYVPREPDVLDIWPLVAVTTGVEATTRRIEHDADGGQFVTSYPMEVYVWVNTENRGPTVEMRDAMATAMKVVLLGQQTFARADQDIYMNDATFEQRFSDLQKVKGDRYVAGSLTAFDVLVTENLGPYGSQSSATVDRVAVRGYSEGTPFAEPTPFPAHPAFE